MNHTEKIKVGIGGNYAKVPTLTENTKLFSSDSQPKNKRKIDKGTGELLPKIQHKKNKLEYITSMLYKYRMCNYQLRFLTFTCECGTPDKVFIESIEKTFKYFKGTKLFSDWIIVFERQKNNTLHCHVIVKMPTRKQTSDFINNNRLLKNKEYNGKKITKSYQLLRYKFEQIIGTNKHLHLDFRKINGDNVQTMEGAHLGTLNHYLTKYMLKTENLQCSCLKYSFRTSKSLKKLDAIYLQKKDIVKMKHDYYFNDGTRDFGKLQINRSLFNLFQNYDYDQQNKVNDSIRYFEGELKKLLPKIQNKQNSENKPILSPKKNHPTFTLLELNFEPQSDINTQYT